MGGVNSYSKLFSTVIPLWAIIINQLKNLREFTWILFSLILGVFKSCTLNFTSMVDVTDCPSSFFCISLPSSSALSALTLIACESSLEWHKGAARLDLGQRDHSPQTNYKLMQLFRHLSSFVFHQDLCEVCCVFSYLPPCTGWCQQSGLVFAPSTCGLNHPNSTFWLCCLHQFLLNTDVTPSSRPFMGRVSNNMAPICSKFFENFFVLRQRFKLFHQLTIQPCTLGILMMPCPASW